MSNTSPGPEQTDPDADGIVGSCIDYPCNVLPSKKWMWADGAAISRSQYSLLFSRMGTQHGTGDGSTTFNLPNRTGKFPVGYDPNDTDFDSVGESGGSKTGSVSGTTGAGSAHSHGSTNLSVTGQGSFAVQGGASGNVQAGTNLDVGGSTDSESAHTHSFSGSAATVPPYDVTRYIVKVM